MQTIEIKCCHCGMTGAQVRQVRAEGLDLGEERHAVNPTAPCCNTLYIRDLEEADTKVRVSPYFTKHSY